MPYLKTFYIINCTFSLIKIRMCNVLEDKSVFLRESNGQCCPESTRGSKTLEEA